MERARLRMAAKLRPRGAARNRPYPEIGSGWTLKSAAQIREHGEDAPAAVQRLGQPELHEDAADVALHRLGAEDADLRDPPVGMPLRHEAEDLALARGQLVERPRLAGPVEQPVDDRGVEYALAVRDPPERVAQDTRVTDAFLQQVARPGWEAGEEARRVAGVEIARQEQDGGAGVVLPDLGGRL